MRSWKHTEKFGLFLFSCLVALVLAAAVVGISLTIGRLKTQPAHDNSTLHFTFLVAGHTYGSHEGNNLGLHPPFLKKIKKGLDPNVRFMVFTGDIVRTSDVASWSQVEAELATNPIPHFFVMGNHDDSKVAQNLFRKKYGKTFYALDIGAHRFIMLNSQINPQTISPEQLFFLREGLQKADGIDQFFIFFHDVLWNGNNPNYEHVKTNFRSRTPNIAASNYWSEIHPLFQSLPNKKFFIFAGDTAGNSDSIPAYYEEIGHVTLIASGMGEVREENYLLVHVGGGEVSFELVPLDPQIEMKPLEAYTRQYFKKNT